MADMAVGVGPAQADAISSHLELYLSGEMGPRHGRLM